MKDIFKDIIEIYIGSILAEKFPMLEKICKWIYIAFIGFLVTLFAHDAPRK